MPTQVVDGNGVVGIEMSRVNSAMIAGEAEQQILPLPLSEIQPMPRRFTLRGMAWTLHITVVSLSLIWNG